MFKGGLEDHGEQTTMYHTATHLLLAALKKHVSPTIDQRGSNINADRLPFVMRNFEKSLIYFSQLSLFKIGNCEMSGSKCIKNFLTYFFRYLSILFFDIF